METGGARLTPGDASWSTVLMAPLGSPTKATGEEALIMEKLGAKKKEGFKGKAPRIITSMSEGQLERIRLAPPITNPDIRNEKNYARMPQQIDSRLTGSHKYNCSMKKEHGQGKFLIPRKDPRSTYLGVNDTPGVGSYDIDRYAYDDVGMNTGSDQFLPRKPRYSFGLSQTERDPTVKRFTPHGHVCGSSHHDNPGPARYFGSSVSGHSMYRVGAGSAPSLLHAGPAYTMVGKRQASKGYYWEPTPGADRYFVEGYKDNLQNKRRFPTVRIGTQKREGKALINEVSTSELGGPGRYEHSTSLVTQFPRPTF